MLRGRYGMNDFLSFYRGKKVFVTGHTGFKGSWLCLILERLGATVCGYSLVPSTQPNLFDLLGLAQSISKNNISDIRDLKVLKQCLEDFSPDVVFHLAAQPLVRSSYDDPVYTYETNVMGTVNILESIRTTPSVKSFVNVTTDKVYLNKEWSWGYREIDRLNGFDPYSNSKSCSELVTSSYVNSFFHNRNCSISTARAGNVIGGGDFSKDRIIPDCVRSVSIGLPISIRNPESIRPYQHVFEPLMAYLKLACIQFENKKYQGAYNIGPEESDCVNTKDLVKKFCDQWGNGQTFIVNRETNAPHEANFLKLDISKIKSELSWKPTWNIDRAIEETCLWSKCWLEGGDVRAFSLKQIDNFMEELEVANN